VDANSQLLQERLAAQTAGFAQAGNGMGHAHQQAIEQLALQIHQQAQVMTYSDSFWLLGVCLAVMLPLVMLLRPPPRPPMGAARPGGDPHSPRPIEAAH
jgi:DHA2 family multidrug resistance protein